MNPIYPLCVGGCFAALMIIATICDRIWPTPKEGTLARSEDGKWTFYTSLGELYWRTYSSREEAEIGRDEWMRHSWDFDHNGPEKQAWARKERERNQRFKPEAKQ